MEDKVTLSSSDHDATSALAFRQLWQNKDFVDVTLVTADFKQIKAHRAILASCSSFFRNILIETSHPSPLLFIKGVTFKYLNLIVEFVYLGQCEIDQDFLEQFLKIGRDLDITGLTEEDLTRSEEEIVVVEEENTTLDVKEQVDPLDVHKNEGNNDFAELLRVCNLPETRAQNNEIRSSQQGAESKFSLKVLKANPIMEENDRKYLPNLAIQKTYKCQICQFNTSNKIDLIKHRLAQHKRQTTPKVDYKCNQCSFKCDSESNLVHHTTNQHITKKFDCDKCGVSFSNMGSFTIHKISKHEGIRFKCEKCDYKTEDKVKLRRHKLSVHDKLLFQCDKCGYKCTQEIKMDGHKLLHNSVVI